MSVNDVSPDYDVTPDGSSFVVLADDPDATAKGATEGQQAAQQIDVFHCHKLRVACP